MTAPNPPREPQPLTGPTNDRPWPGTRVKIRSTGIEGVVDDYEYGWNSGVFPVVLRLRRHRVTAMYSPSQIIELGNSVTPLHGMTTDTTTGAITTHATGTIADAITGPATTATPAACTSTPSTASPSPTQLPSQLRRTGAA